MKKYKVQLNNSLSGDIISIFEAQNLKLAIDYACKIKRLDRDKFLDIYNVSAYNLENKNES
jgi:hypothetical protein